MITAVLGIILISYLFIPVVASSVVTVTENQNPSWVRMAYTEEDFSFSAVVSGGNMTIDNTQTGEATEMMLFACDSGMLMYDDGFKLIYQSAGNTVVRESDATAIAVSCNNKTVTVLMGGVTYSMPMTWAYYPDAEGIYSYFPTDSYNFREGDPVAVFGDFAGVIAYDDMVSLDVGLDFKATVQGKHLNKMHWVKLSEGESATDIGTVTGTPTKTDTDNASNTESVPVSNVVTGYAHASMSVMNAGNSTTYTDRDWQYILDGTDAIITGYTGTSVSWLTIPATVGGYSVKQVGNGTEVLGSLFIRNLEISEGIQIIGDYAFKDSDIPDSIRFPASLTSIGDYAFAGCNCSHSLNLHSTHLVSIGDYAFDQCSSFTGTLGLPSTLVTIGDYAFRSCWSLSGILSIPSSVTTIGDFAFNICQGFSGLMFGSGIQTIGESAFESCTSMGGTLYIPASVTSIGDYAFYDCKFTTVSINPVSPTIGQQAFAFDTQSGSSTVTVINHSNVDLSNPTYGLVNAVFKVDGWQYRIIWEQSGGVFTSKYAIAVHHDPFTNVSVTIPSSVVSGTVTYDVKQIGDGESAIATISNCTLTIPNSIERINANAFINTGLTGTITIPDSVTIIGDNAFIGCAGLTGALVIPDSVTSIGREAFRNCFGLTSLTLGDSVQTIGAHAFDSCIEFTGTLTLPNSVTTIGDSAFVGCGFTGSLVIPNSVVTIGEGAFDSCSGFTGSLTLGNNVQTIGYYAFNHCSGFTGSLVIPDSVTTIEYNAFSYCSGLTSLTLGSSLQTIGARAFNSCSGLTGSLVIPNSVTTLGDSAFNGCSGFTSLTLGNGVQTIPDKAFADCGFKGTVTILSTVTEIGIEAFKGCSDLINLVVFSNPTVGTDAFVNTGIKEVLNLGTTEFTKTSYGLNADEVRTDIQADGCIAIVHDEQEKTDTVSTLMKILPIIILMVLLVLIAGPMFGMSFGRGGSDSSDSDEYDYY